MKVLSINSKDINGQSYNIIKSQSLEAVSEKEYKETTESYGRELVHFHRYSKGQFGYIYDIMVAV